MASLVTESIVLTPKMHLKPKPEARSSNGSGFFNILDNPTSKHVENEVVYVHPMVKRCASALSTVSLEMCTESLGTETGSDVSESSDEFKREEKLSNPMKFDRKRLTIHRGGGGGFPPPLTSINGSDGTVKVRPYREGGRLVIKAVSVSNCGTKFEAHRTNGRLSLNLLRDSCENVKTETVKVKNENTEEVYCDSDVEEGGNMRRLTHSSTPTSKVGSPKRKHRVPNSFEESTELGLTKCKDGRNGNKGMGNWSLFRVVIS